MTTTPGLIVNVDVDGLEKAVAFYTSIFGLTVGRRFGDAGAEILGTSAPLCFLVNSSGPGFEAWRRGAVSGLVRVFRDLGRDMTPNPSIKRQANGFAVCLPLISNYKGFPTSQAKPDRGGSLGA